MTKPPLSLYVHIPWCERKCPYCDFNSHANKTLLDEKAYLAKLQQDWQADAELFALSQRPIESIFIGGGTPSLLSAGFYQALLDGLSQSFQFNANTEITLEANPGSSEQARFQGYRQASINRLSIGVQSFDDGCLQKIGRVHDSKQARQAVLQAEKAGFDNINVDLMYGLPTQTPAQAERDLQTAMSLPITHLSWYQLTLEPNTLFYRQPPPLPGDDTLAAIEQQGYTLLATQGFKRYEVSAFCKNALQCQHNVNYWQYGDYLGIGAGAHSKITQGDNIWRFYKSKHPKSYLQEHSPRQPLQAIPAKERLFEFMLNHLRLKKPVDFTLFEQRSGIARDRLLPYLDQAAQKGWLDYNKTSCTLSEQGLLFLNDVTALFLQPDAI